MDPEHFDVITQTLWTASSRRTAVGLLLGGIFGAGRFSSGEAKKKHKKHKKHKRRHPCATSCEGRHCGDDGCDGSCGACTADQTCVDGACCTPKSVPATCGGECGPHSNNCEQPVNCGACPAGGCTPNPCRDGGDSAATCTETAGSYHCACDTGYLFNGVTCTPPCVPGGDPCAPGGTCTSTGGSSYTCSCNAGYVYNGATCLPE